MSYYDYHSHASQLIKHTASNLITALLTISEVFLA